MHIGIVQAPDYATPAGCVRSTEDTALIQQELNLMPASDGESWEKEGSIEALLTKVPATWVMSVLMVLGKERILALLTRRAR